MGDSWLPVPIALVVVPALLILAVPRRWLVRTILLWLLVPFIAYAGMILWETVTRPAPAQWLAGALYPLFYASAFLLLPWLGLCLVGFVLGFGLRRLLRRPARPAPPADPPAFQPPPQPPQVEAAGWRSIHVGFAKDGLMIAGRDIWAESWRPTGETVHLPHPGHREQIHRYDVHEVGSPFPVVRFAAGELSNGVWGFYIPTSETELAHGSSANGAIRYEYSLGEMIGHRYDTTAAWAVVMDGATGAVLVDGSAWLRSRVSPQPDGSLFLHLSVNRSDALFRLDPETMQFRNLGAGGPDRPLAELAADVEQERLAAIRPVPLMTRLSPDGTIQVEIQAVEWSNSHWVDSPRVIDMPSGRVVLDLWNTDWDATVDFPGPRLIRLGFRRYHGGGAFAAELDLARDTWRLPAEPGRPEAPLSGLMEGLEEAFREASAGSRWIGPKLAPEPKRMPAWRMILLMLAVAIGVIGVSLFIALYLTPEPQRPPLDRVPSFEMPPIRR